MADAIGLMAGALTTVAFVPQVLKTWRSRSAQDLSLSMLVIFNAGVAMWEIYGLIMHAPPIIIANAVTLTLSLTMLALKLRRP